MAAVAPYAILVGMLSAIVFVFASFWEPLGRRVREVAPRFTGDMETAGMTLSSERYIAVLAGVAAVLWLVVMILMQADPLMGIVLLAASLAVSGYGGRWWLARKRARRIELFRDQLEGALRTLSGGVRVGLGIRQALVLTSEQSPEPAKTEFMRVVGLSNLGLSVLDAFDHLAGRMTNTETAVLARVIRVQAQSGGDLGSVLEGLAGTIRDRRRLRRRVTAVTAQGKATAWLLGLLPIGVGLFVLTQGELRDAMLNTIVGRILLGIALILDAIAIYTLSKIATIEP